MSSSSSSERLKNELLRKNAEREQRNLSDAKTLEEMAKNMKTYSNHLPAIIGHHFKVVEDKCAKEALANVRKFKTELEASRADEKGRREHDEWKKKLEDKEELLEEKRALLADKSKKAAEQAAFFQEYKDALKKEVDTIHDYVEYRDLLTRLGIIQPMESVSSSQVF